MIHHDRNIWHPYTQMLTANVPLEIVRAEGAYLYTAENRKILDAVSSWWVTVHGHADPYVAEAIAEQARVMEQVIFAGFTHPQAERLAERLTAKLPEKIRKVFFSDDGSTAVEVAIKMVWQYWHNQETEKTVLLALDKAYHGDTFGAMAVSGRSVFTKAFDPLLFDVVSLPNPGENPQEVVLRELRKHLSGNKLAGIILEPLVMGAGGMLMYSPETLDEIIRVCREHDVPVIFDEVMTGFGRTGTLFACDQTTLKPDIICLSKGLTGGFLPMSVTCCTDDIYNAFLSQDRSKALFHGHSYTANPIACAAANASLDLFESRETIDRIEMIADLQQAAKPQFEALPQVTNVRQTGTILAMDIISQEGGYLDKAGPALARWFLEKDVLLRPLGNALYLMPPYITTKETLAELHELVERGIREVTEKA